MALDQENRSLTIKMPVSTEAVLEEFHGEEALSQPFFYRLTIVCETKKLDPTGIVGQTIEISVDHKTGDKQPFHGYVLSLTRVEADEEDDLYRYRLEVVPHFWFLKFKSDNRVFQEKTAVQIIEEVLENHTDVKLKKILSTAYPQREYCVQFGESDFDFLSRLMEEEGIFYYFERTDSSHTLVLGDGIKSYQQAQEKDPEFSGSRDSSAAADLMEWEETTEFVTGNYHQKDFNFQAPKTVFEGKSKSVLKLKDSQKQEVYEYPAGYHFGDVDASGEEKKRWPEVRQQELDVPGEIVSGESHCVSWSPGFKFKKETVEYVLTSVTHRYSDPFGQVAGPVGDQLADERHNYFTAMVATRNFRPPRVTPRARIYGIQSAIVVGPSGKEVYTDEFGRVKVQFHWDRLGKNDGKSSCFIRVAQQWAGKDRGFLFLPRVGDEVLVQFINGDGDRPIIVGSVYNDQSTIPKAQPDNKALPDPKADVISGIWTMSSQNGTADTRHELLFDDTEKAELITFQSQRDFKRIVKNDDVLEVGLETKEKGDQTITIHNDQTLTLKEGNQSETLEKGNRKVEIKQGNDDLTIEKGDQTVTIKQGKRTVEVNSDDNLTVKSGNLTINVSAGKMSVEAAQSIELKVGGSSIKLEPAAITMKSPQVTIEGQATTTVKGAMCEINGSGTTTIKGAIVKIN